MMDVDNQVDEINRLFWEMKALAGYDNLYVFHYLFIKNGKAIMSFKNIFNNRIVKVYLGGTNEKTLSPYFD